MIRALNSMTGRLVLLVLVGTMLTTVLGFAFALSGVHHPFVILVYCVCLLAIAIVAARIATKPLRELASAATRLENDIESDPLPDRGPTEVRDAALAFNAMQARIRRDVGERTAMLAAITHDLQTPVTRLRLRLEKVGDEALRAKLVADLATMGETIREGLDLATSLDARERLQRVDFDSLIESLCTDAHDAGEDVTATGHTGSAVLAAPNALRRCIANLVDNAIAYGRYARVEMALENGSAVARIRDGGPGIPEDRLQAVLEPFVRIEASRSRETGGTGIGLTIAKNIATRLGGSIALRNHPDGGLEATLRLPRTGA